MKKGISDEGMGRIAKVIKGQEDYSEDENDEGEEVSSVSEVAGLIEEALYELAEENGTNVNIQSLASGGYLTEDEGLELRFGDSVYVVTIKQKA